VRNRLPEGVASAVQPVVDEALAGGPLAPAIRVDSEKLFIDDQATTAGSGHVSPSTIPEFRRK
jgi:hypothetical protein